MPIAVPLEPNNASLRLRKEGVAICKQAKRSKAQGHVTKEYIQTKYIRAMDLFRQALKEAGSDKYQRVLACNNMFLIGSKHVIDTLAKVKMDEGGSEERKFLDQISEVVSALSYVLATDLSEKDPDGNFEKKATITGSAWVESIAMLGELTTRQRAGCLALVNRKLRAKGLKFQSAYNVAMAHIYYVELENAKVHTQELEKELGLLYRKKEENEEAIVEKTKELITALHAKRRVVAELSGPLKAVETSSHQWEGSTVMNDDKLESMLATFCQEKLACDAQIIALEDINALLNDYDAAYANDAQWDYADRLQACINSLKETNIELEAKLYSSLGVHYYKNLGKPIQARFLLITCTDLAKTLDNKDVEHEYWHRIANDCKLLIENKKYKGKAVLVSEEVNIERAKPEFKAFQQLLDAAKLESNAGIPAADAASASLSVKQKYRMKHFAQEAMKLFPAPTLAKEVKEMFDPKTAPDSDAKVWYRAFLKLYSGQKHAAYKRGIEFHARVLAIEEIATQLLWGLITNEDC